jgi:phospholipase C
MFALSGTSNGRVLMPDGVKQLEMLFTQTQETLFDRLNTRQIPWHVYYYDFPCSLLLKRQHASENRRRYLKIDRFFEAARGPASDFPVFAFLEPKYFGLDQNDDHPPHNAMKAQKLIADVYNAIRSNPELWATTLLAIVYDEHGGFYDHVEPPPATPPDGQTDEYSFTRLGVRVPAVLVSPHLARGVLKTELEHTSFLRYLMEKWGLDPLGERTKGPDVLGSSLPWAPAMRSDTIPFIRIPYSDLIPAEPDWERKDVREHQQGLRLLAKVLEAGPVTEHEVNAAARDAKSRESSWARARAAMGDRLIEMGRALRGPLETLEDDPVADVTP